MMKTPLISCIVPVFNGERSLGETLDSSFSTSLPNHGDHRCHDGSDPTARLRSIALRR